MEKLSGYICYQSDWFAIATENRVAICDSAGRSLTSLALPSVAWRYVAGEPDGSTITAAGILSPKASVLAVWKRQQNLWRMLWKKQIHGVVEALAYAEGVVALCASDTLQLLRVGDSTQISQVRLPQPMECLHVGSHGVWLGSSRGELWRYHNQSLARVAKLGVGEVLCIGSHRNTVYAGSADTLIHVYDISASRITHRMVGHASEVVCIHVQSSQLLSAGVQGDLSLWKPESHYPDYRVMHTGQNPSAIAPTAKNDACWALLSEGVFQVDWTRQRATKRVSRQQIMLATQTKTSIGGK